MTEKTYPPLPPIGADVILEAFEKDFYLRESTAHMSIARASSLIEYTLAFCAEHGVTLRDARQWEINPETGEIS